MPISHAAYPLQNGYIVNWLTAGPQIFPVTEQAEPKALARRFYEEKSQIPATPVERGPLTEGIFTIGDYQGSWSYTACGDDRLVDHSAVYPTCSFVRSWAYTELVSDAAGTLKLTLVTFGPVDVWFNKKHILHEEEFSNQPRRIDFEAVVSKGSNRILVRFAAVAAPEAVQAFALQVRESAASLTVQIPTLIPSLERRAELENVNRRLYLDREVYTNDQMISLLWPEELEKQSYSDVRLQTHSGRIYAQADDAGKPGDRKLLGLPVSLHEGPYRVFVMPRAWEYYEKNIRVEKYLDLYVTGRTRYSFQPYGTPESRRIEALRHAAAFEGSLYADIARMALGAWDRVEAKSIQQALDSIRGLEHDSDLLLLGLLGALARYGEQDHFLPEWKEQIAAAAQAFAYAQDGESCGSLAFDQPDRHIVFHACAILAGQLYPQAAFTRAGCTGQQLAEQANAQALAWIRKRGGAGFAAWDSKEGYAVAFTALSHLIDLDDNQDVFELGSLLIDKILFSIAINSFQGVFGTPQGRAATEGIKSGLLEATSGVTRLLWGMGIFTRHTHATVSMAQMTEYEFPPLLAEISFGGGEPIWNREQHALGGTPANKVTYRTGGYMLSSVQDYRAGEQGSREHIWQATLSPQAVVFTNHPGNSSQNDAHAPNFWLGNGSLPRVAQWKDTLIAIYNLPEDSWMDFTHAYFPTVEFDEVTQEGNTIFGRKGDGYIALTAKNGLNMPVEGPTAHRELRSPGPQNIWLCRMGSAAEDGDLPAFQARINENPPVFDGQRVQLKNLRSESLSFGWEEPFLLNGQEVPLRNFPHYDNPFTTAELNSKQFEIKNEAYLLRLNFGDPASDGSTEEV